MLDIVKLLLAKGADVSAKDQQGRTAFSMAEAAGESQVADLLKSACSGTSRVSLHRAEAIARKGPPSLPIPVPRIADQAAQRLTLAREVTDPLRVNLAGS